jgi:threonine aldolase
VTTISFGSDNHAGAHPDVLAAVVAANTGTVPGYGDDALTGEAVALVREHFGADAEVAFVFNGTGANVVGLQTMVRSFESVICAETAHINVDECGAPEKFLGAKLVDVATVGGKLTPDLVDAARWGVGDPHHVQAKVISITQSTELGTVYSLEEIRALSAYAHERDMYLHLDGARIANAAVSLGVDLGELGRASGVDVLSFGAT